jgi:hypothetical protein
VKIKKREHGNITEEIFDAGQFYTLKGILETISDDEKTSVGWAINPTLIIYFEGEIVEIED